MTLSCDLFCAVVDNLGDAGVCWRLARQLAAEHGWRMRLWIDDPAALAGLRPGLDPAMERQVLDGVDIRRWPAPFPAVSPAAVVIEAFACELPAGYVAAMAALPHPPVWINLEYLSAEDWVDGCHGLPSPHPALPLTKHFFFPGFFPGTGGLLRERDLTVAPAPTNGRWPSAINLPAKPDARDAEGDAFAGTLQVSLFCYDNPALPCLLDAWSADSASLRCLVADGLPRRQVESWLGAGFECGTTARRGSLVLEALPFLSQTDYDRVLGSCALNFVRGEDSFVRAQWAERPFVWQIYPQAGDAHFGKLAAFLERYRTGLPASAGTALEGFWQAWNGRGDVASAWSPFRAALPVLAAHAPEWATRIRQHGDLATNLAKFCLQRL